VLFRALVVLLGVMIRLILDKFISKLISYIWPRSKGPEPDISGESRYYGWDLAVKETHD
jgi:hypothetical protein